MQLLQEELLGTPEVSSTDSIPTGFWQPEVMGIYLPGTGALGRGAWYEAGTPSSQDISPEFVSPTCQCGTSQSASVPLLPVWMYVVSLILQLSEFYSTQFLMVLIDGCSIS